MVNDIINRIKRKWEKVRLQPIRVYCLHHVCAEFDAESMNECDYMLIDEFKQKVKAMRQKGVEFISLMDAYRHICNDWFRFHEYAVLTFDDGYASLKEILPWLEEQHIPATLFINGKYLDGKSYRKNPKERYLTHDELFALSSSFIEIGSHGYEHINAKLMTEKEFEDYIRKNVSVLSKHPRYIPFHSYTWDAHSSGNDKALRAMRIVPVTVGGTENYGDVQFVHRGGMS